MVVAGILSSNKYNLRSKTRRRRNGVKFKLASSKDDVYNSIYCEYVNVDKDNMKSGNKTIVRRLVGVYGSKTVDKQIDDLVKLGPEYYPSWSDIGCIEQRMRFVTFNYLIRVSNNKLKKNFISIWKTKTDENRKNPDNVDEDPMDVDMTLYN